MKPLRVLNIFFTWSHRSVCPKYIVWSVSQLTSVYLANMSLIFPMSGFFNPSCGLRVKSAWVNTPDILPIVLENILLYHFHWRTSNFLLPTFTTSDQTRGGCDTSFSFFLLNHHFIFPFIRAKNHFFGSSFTRWPDSGCSCTPAAGSWTTCESAWAECAWESAGVCVSEWKVNVASGEIFTQGILGCKCADHIIFFLWPWAKTAPSSHFLCTCENFSHEGEDAILSVLWVAVESI